MKPTYSPGRRFSSVEPLEARIAPAALIDARTVAYTDADGDVDGAGDAPKPDAE